MPVRNACIHLASLRWTHVWFSAEDGDNRGSLNVQANFLCSQAMITQRHTRIIIKPRMGRSLQAMYGKHRTSTLRSHRATQWLAAQMVCRPLTRT
jgi:hypothetical protein